MSKLSTIAAGAVALPMLAFSAPAFADSPGQLTGGSNVFQVKNLTQNGSYGSTAGAACNDELKYSVMLHNAAYGGLTSVEVKANLSAGTVSAVPAEGASAGTTGNVKVTVAEGGTLNYEEGSSQLFKANTDGSTTLVKALPDGVTSTGVNIGDIQGSTTEFVVFKAKVACETTPPKTCQPGQTGTFPNCTTPTTPTKPSTPNQPKTLVNTGAGDVAGIFAGAALAGFAAFRLRLNRLARR